jgi:peptidoglycan DL-endopeptidase CwlO
MTGALSAVQARITELQALVDPASATSTSTSTAASASSSTSFASALAALGLSTSSTSTETSIAPGSGVTGADLVEAATQYLGVPYVWGGESLDEGGLDCSGLVQRALADLGITDVPRTAREQQTLGTEVASLDEAQPGDLVVFGGGTHIGIYVGDGKMIDAPSAGRTVTIRDVYTEPTTIRRILPSEGSTASPTSSSLSGTSLSALSSLVSSASGQSALALLTGSSSTTDLSSVLSALTSGSTSGSTSALSSLSALAALTGSSSTSSSALSSSSLLSSLWGSVS